jgi:hypothetical protein
MDNEGWKDYMDENFDWLCREFIESQRAEFEEFCKDEYNEYLDIEKTKDINFNPNLR